STDSFYLLTGSDGGLEGSPRAQRHFRPRRQSHAVPLSLPARGRRDPGGGPGRHAERHALRVGPDARREHLVLSGRLSAGVVPAPAAVELPAQRLRLPAAAELRQGAWRSRLVGRTLRAGADDDLRRPRATDAGRLGEARPNVPPGEASRSASRRAE